MKNLKLFALLTVISLTSFTFTGCDSDENIIADEQNQFKTDLQAVEPGNAGGGDEDDEETGG